MSVTMLSNKNIAWLNEDKSTEKWSGFAVFGSSKLGTFNHLSSVYKLRKFEATEHELPSVHDTAGVSSVNITAWESQEKEKSKEKERKVKES